MALRYEQKREINDKWYRMVSKKLAIIRRYEIAMRRIILAKDLKTAQGIARNVSKLNLC